jgi:hypothetical protein
VIGNGPKRKNDVIIAGIDAITHDPEKLVLDMIGDGTRFSDKIMRKKAQ